MATLNTEYARWWKRIGMAAEYALLRRGPLTMAPSQLGAFARSGPEYDTANLQFHFQPLSLDKFGDALHPFGAFTASVCNLRPSSRGHIHAASPDPRAAPAIQPNYLDTDEDKRVAVAAIRLARRIAQQEPLARYQPQEFKPGAAIIDDDALAQVAGDIGTHDLPSGRHRPDGRG